MKKLLAVIGLLGLSSCKKDFQCVFGFELLEETSHIYRDLDKDERQTLEEECKAAGGELVEK